VWISLSLAAIHLPLLLIHLLLSPSRRPALEDTGVHHSEFIGAAPSNTASLLEPLPPSLSGTQATAVSRYELVRAASLRHPMENSTSPEAAALHRT